MVAWLKAFTVITEDLGSVPSAHRAVPNHLKFQGSSSLFWGCMGRRHVCHTQTSLQETPIYIKNRRKYLKGCRCGSVGSTLS